MTAVGRPSVQLDLPSPRQLLDRGPSSRLRSRAQALAEQSFPRHAPKGVIALDTSRLETSASRFGTSRPDGVCWFRRPPAICECVR
jgi:hypothetical protein